MWMNVMGTVELKCTTDQDLTTANIFCLVSHDLNDYMLISYDDPVDLQRIHPGFPHVRVHNHSAMRHVTVRSVNRDITSELMEKYKDVLSDGADAKWHGQK